MSLKYEDVQAALDALARDSAVIDSALKQVGYPPERTGSRDEMSLARIIVGQQLSTKAAASINKRLADLLGEEQYAKIPNLEDEELRAVGLSRPKIRYLRALTDAVLRGALPFDQFDTMSDHEVVECLTALPGFGRWSAHMYLLFNLQRPDVWPTGDLAVRVGVSRMLGSSERLSEAEVEQAGEVWRPHRSAVALLAWHYYAKVPLV